MMRIKKTVTIALVGVALLLTNAYANGQKAATKTIVMTVSVVADAKPTTLQFKISNKSSKPLQLFGFHDGSGRNEVLLITPAGKKFPHPIRKDFQPNAKKLLFKPGETRVYEMTIEKFMARITDKSGREIGDYTLLWQAILGDGKNDTAEAQPFVFTLKKK